MANRSVEAAPEPFLRIGPIQVDRDYLGLLTQLGVRNLTEAMAAPLGEPLDKPGLEAWRRRSRLVLPDLFGQPRTVYVKRFVRPPAGEQIRRILSGRPRHGTAWVEWHNIEGLRGAGVPTMRPVLFAEKLKWLWELGSLIATEAVPGEALERWLPAGWNAAVARHGFGWRRTAVWQLADLVRRLHAARLCHRDLYTSHVFVHVTDGGAVQYHVIDLQRMFSPRWRLRRWQVKDLAALAGSAPVRLISRTDRMRFLLSYLGLAKLDRQAKRWWLDVARKAARMMRHHEARMRRLAEKA